MTLGPGGVKTDIVTGLPHQRQRLTKEAIENQIQQATNISVKLELDLQGEGGTVLETLVETIAAHAEQVLSKDPVYQLYMKFVESLGLKIQVLPKLMERQLRHAIPEAKRPAPFGITGKKI